MSPRRADAGFSLVGLMAALSVMLLLMTVGMPSWRYVMQNAREEELLFRGTQIAEAIERYQKKNGGALPVSLEMLVQGKFLRKLYTDPMTKDGKWRLLRPGEPVGVPQAGRPRASPSAAPSARPTPPGRPGMLRPGGPGGFGPIAGVVSLSKEKSLRVFNGRTRYDEWAFMAGQPRVVGKDQLWRPPSAPQPQRSPRRP